MSFSMMLLGFGLLCLMTPFVMIKGIPEDDVDLIIRLFQKFPIETVFKIIMITNSGAFFVFAGIALKFAGM